MKALLSLLVLGLAISQAPAITVIAGGNETGTNIGFGQEFIQGMDFTPSANGFLTGLGLWDNNSDGMDGRFAVGLWDTATAVLLASAWIDDSDALDPGLTVAGGQYRYESMGSPLALTGGNTYTLGVFLHRALTADESLILDPPVAGSGLTIGAYRRWEPGSALDFPNETGGTNLIGNVNAKISGTNSVPDTGASLVLLALSLAGLGGVKRLVGK